MAHDDPRIVEQDGIVVRIVAGEVEVMAEMTRESDDLIFDRLSIDGPGPQALGLARLKELARRFAKTQGSGEFAYVARFARRVPSPERFPARW